MATDTRIGNWCRALCDNLPGEILELRAEVAELDKKKADRLAVIADYEELLAIARRREPAPVVKELHPFMAEDAAA